MTVMFIFREPKIIEIYKERAEDIEWRSLHGIADQAKPEMIEAFQKAVERTKADMNLTELEQAMLIANVEIALNTIPWETFISELASIGIIYKTIFDRAGNKSIDYLPDDIELKASFNTLNPKSLDYIKDHTGELIVEITEQTQLAVRAIINDAFIEGLHPYQSAREIKKIVGLTERQAKAVNNLRKSLIIQKLSDKVIEQRTKAYARRLLIYRSNNIARTETINAANRGQQALWEQTEEQGLINRATARRKWITTPDDRLCQWCKSLDGKIVGLGEEFGTPIISGINYTALTPTLHPSCRCALGLVFI